MNRHDAPAPRCPRVPDAGPPPCPSSIRWRRGSWPGCIAASAWRSRRISRTSRALPACIAIAATSCSFLRPARATTRSTSSCSGSTGTTRTRNPNTITPAPSSGRTGVCSKSVAARARSASFFPHRSTTSDWNSTTRPCARPTPPACRYGGSRSSIMPRPGPSATTWCARSRCSSTCPIPRPMYMPACRRWPKTACWRSPCRPRTVSWPLPRTRR